MYQFMTQKDAKTNIALVESSAAIAKAAKADSSAMKTIAWVLGMFFLPGAFVAVSFQKPILAIQNISSLVVRRTGRRLLTLPRQSSQCRSLLGTVMVCHPSNQPSSTTGPSLCLSRCLYSWLGDWRCCYLGIDGISDSRGRRRELETLNILHDEISGKISTMYSLMSTVVYPHMQ